jgi:hypothetical protein
MRSLISFKCGDFRVTREEVRLSESATRKKHWKRWGPYLSERAWVFLAEIIALSAAASDPSTIAFSTLHREPASEAKKPVELPSEQRNLRCHSRTQANHHSPVARLRVTVTHYFIENKHYRWRGHVSIITQHGSREA